MSWLAIACAAALAVPIPVAAQQAAVSGLVEVDLREGTSIVGVVTSDERDRVVLRLADGTEISIARSGIKRLTPAAGQVVDGAFWREDALDSKLFLSGTGRSLRRGAAYAAIYQFAVPVVHVGVTDRISFGIGKPFYVFSPDIWITPKVQIYRGTDASVAAGVLHFHIAREGYAQVFYGAGTFGSPDQGVTIGGGWMRARIDDSHGGVPLLILGGERRTGPRVKVLTENYLFRGGAIFSLGVRVVGRRTFYVETGGVLAVGPGTRPIPGPFVSFIWAGR